MIRMSVSTDIEKFLAPSPRSSTSSNSSPAKSNIFRPECFHCETIKSLSLSPTNMVFASSIAILPSSYSPFIARSHPTRTLGPVGTAPTLSTEFIRASPLCHGDQEVR
jgi:hypothetical protein